MLKKSLIPAALVALSSASAFADADSFHFGLKGLYFKPAASAALGALNKSKLDNSDQKVASIGNILFIGPQFGYHISDSIRVGVAGYMGFGEFKSEFKAKSQSATSTAPALSTLPKCLDTSPARQNTVEIQSALDALECLKHAQAYVDTQNAAIRSHMIVESSSSALHVTKASDSFNLGLLGAADRVIPGASVPPSMAMINAIDAKKSTAEKCDEALAQIRNAKSSRPVLLPGEVADVNLQKYAVNFACLTKKAREIAEAAMQEVFSETDIAKQKEAIKKIVDAQPELKKQLDALTASGVQATANPVTPDAKEGKWTETIAPRGVILATVDAKLFENDAFSLGAGIGVGATNWKATWKLESESQKDDAADLPSKKESTAWALSGMGTVNASIGLGDVATLTASAGYMHLGNPEFTYGNTNGGATGTNFKADESRSQGWVFGIGIGKDF